MKPVKQIPAPLDWPTAPAKPEPGGSRRGGFGSSKPPPPSDLDPDDEELFSGRHQQGGVIKRAPEIPEGRAPVPRVRGNLPVVPNSGVERGREVPAKPMEWHERANPRSSGGGSLKQGPWENPPQPPPGVPSRDIVDMAQLHRVNPELYSDPAKRLPEYSGGGMVKHGSSTRITCRTKHG